MTGRRGPVEGLENARPIGQQLPALYQEDEFALRFTGALDDVLAPVLLTLDCLSAYFDPWLAPSDMLTWLAGWVGAEVYETWTLAKRREVVARAVDLYRRQGTVPGLAERIELVFGVTPEIEESGGVTASATPGAPLPGRPEPALVVRLRVDDPTTVDVRRLDVLVAAVKPAHVPHRVEVLGR
jgi:phage tail-like protein